MTLIWLLVLLLLCYLYRKYNKLRYEDNYIEELKRCNYYMTRLLLLDNKDESLLSNITTIRTEISNIENALLNYNTKELYESTVKLWCMHSDNEIVITLQKLLLKLIVDSVMFKSLHARIFKSMPKKVYIGDKRNLELQIYHACLAKLRSLER